MSNIDPPPGLSGRGARRPPLSRLVGHRPNQGAVSAAKTVVDDLRELLRAEIALAKAEIADGVKAKVMGAGFFIAVAIIGWLAIQVFLVFLGFLFALFLPGWAAVGLVLLLLIIAMAILGWLGYRKMTAAGLSLTTSKASVAQSKQATTEAVDRVKAHTQEGVEEAKATVAEAVEESKVIAGETATEWRERLDERLGREPAASPAQIPASTPVRPADAELTMPPTTPPEAPPIMSTPETNNLASQTAAVDRARTKLVADIDVLDTEVRLEVLYRMESLAWKVVAGLAAATAGLAATKVLNVIWAKIIPDTVPPEDPTDPDTSAKEAVIWTALTGLGVGVAAVVAQRGAAKGWSKATGRTPPPFEKKRAREAAAKR